MCIFGILGCVLEECFYKMSCFCSKKQDIICIFASRYDSGMMITQRIKEILDITPPGKVLSIADFDVPQERQPTLVRGLSRMVANGSIQKIAKGRYYKPKETVFGTLKPSVAEVVKDLLERNGRLVGYMTGTAAFAQLGLTTQITSSITIGTNKYRRPLKRGGYTITFMVQSNPITKENIPLLLILDAVKLFREMPGTSPDDCIRGVGRLIAALSEEDQKRLATLSENYAPYVRALLGAILENLGLNTYGLRATLNGVTTYKLPVSKQALPSKSAWNIV